MLDERQLSAAEVAQKQVASANEPVLIEVLTDSDWAGAADRISTSSCHVFVNGNLAYAFVRKQGCVSLSSCEAELVSAVSGTAEGLYIAHVIRTAGACTTRIVLRLDSSSARSLLYKQGVSRVRHLATKLLWIQSFTKRKVIEPAAIPTVHNTSDLGTKPLTSKRIALLMRKIGYNSEYDNVQAVRSNAHVKALKKAVAAILVLTMTTEADALEPHAGVQLRDERLLHPLLHEPSLHVHRLSHRAGHHCQFGDVQGFGIEDFGNYAGPSSRATWRTRCTWRTTCRTTCRTT